MKDFPVDNYRSEFPILSQQINGNPLAYFDNAATTQKPKCVIEKIMQYCYTSNANIHRGTDILTERATEEFESARQYISDFIGSPTPKQCVFVKGATEAINLVAHGFEQILMAGDEILISQIEHHANIIPWQVLCQKKDAKLKIIPCNDQGELILSEFEKLLSKRTKLLAVTHIANALGSINPVEKMIEMAHAQGVPVLIDGAQAIAHLPIDVVAMGCDFYLFSGHKLYGPTGVGVLYATPTWLERLPPYQTGGEMVTSVSFEKTSYQPYPYKFEAGTPAIIEVIALKEAIQFINQIGVQRIYDYEKQLSEYAIQQLSDIPKLKFIGRAAHKGCIHSFILDTIHPHDIGTILNQLGIVVRTGRHCAEPTMARFGIDGTTRLSFGLYNTRSEIDRVCEALHQVLHIFKGHL